MGELALGGLALEGVGVGGLALGGLALGRLVDESVVELAGEQCFSALSIYDFMRFPSINIVELSRCPTFAPAQCAGA